MNSIRMTRTWLFFLVVTALMLAVQPASADEPPVFEKDVLPIFTRYCFNCHGKSSPQLGLDLRTARHALKGSQNGPVIVKGSLEKSLLWEKVSKREMPLALFKLKLTDAEIETIRQWIVAGAPSEESHELPEDVQAQFAHFETRIEPIFKEKCIDCHGADDPEAGLDLRSLESLLRGSKKGPVIVEGFSDKSVLIRKLTGKAMPPPEFGEALSADEISHITKWIDKGRFADFVDVDSEKIDAADAADVVTEKDREFWAFQKPVAAELPPVVAHERVRTPIDQFLLARLEEVGLTFSPDADRQTLLRRATFDLTGLPPTPERAQEFLKDDRPDAYERLIDELLDSPRYGERWGRHWLDVVGYVDTTGKDFDPNNASLSDGYWRYRDYVIAATNKDIPWNRFLVEQIAGDELVDWRNAPEYTPEIRDSLVATGFLRNVLDATDEDISDLPFDRYEALFKLMERVSTSTMGMTLACARCHSHKFDPIPQTDYYRFLSLFTAAYNPSDWLPPSRRHLFDVSKQEQEKLKRQHGEVTAQLNGLKGQVNSLRMPYRQRLADEKLLKLPESIREDAKTAVATEEKQRTEVQKYLAEKLGKMLSVTEYEVDASLTEADRQRTAELQTEIVTAEKRLESLKAHPVQALWDVGEAPTIRLLHRGDVDFAGPKVSPGFLSVLSAPGNADAVPSPQAMGETTGLRLAFAEWLTSKEHPLTARVIVNRMWQHHFGTGIVSTPGNFGKTGAPPTHPELLDWLAVEFMRQGWSAKKLHKQIMLSTAYRQGSSRKTERNQNESLPDPQKVDPENKLLWRMNLRRLDAEALRDSVIAVSGNADDSMGGPPVALSATQSGLQSVPGDGQAKGSRRSIYLVARRSNPVTFLRVFDFPVIDVNCTQRSTSATPLQSLTMINSEFLAGSAELMTAHIEKVVGSGATFAQKAEMAFWLAYARPPSAQELAEVAIYIDQLKDLYAANSTATDPQDKTPADRRAFQNFVHMLLCSNEFLYVD